MGAHGNFKRSVLALFYGDARLHALYLARKSWDGIRLTVIRAAFCKHLLRHGYHRALPAEIHFERVEREAFELYIAQALSLKEHAVYLGHIRAAFHEPCGQYVRACGRVRKLETARVGRNASVEAVCNRGGYLDSELVCERTKHLRARSGRSVNTERLRVFGVRAVMIDAQVNHAAVLLGRRVGEQLYIRHIYGCYKLRLKIAAVGKPLEHKAILRGYLVRAFEPAALAERLQHMHQRIAAAERVSVRMGVAQHEYIIVFAQQFGRARNVNSHLHLPSSHRAYGRYSCRALSSRRRQI